jgi:hypothetical protein
MGLLRITKQCRLNCSIFIRPESRDFNTSYILKSELDIDIEKTEEASTNEDGHKALQLPGSDYVEVNGYGVIGEYVLLGLFILAALYGFIALIISSIRFLKHKRALGIIEIYRAIVNASVIITIMMFVYITVKLSSSLALREDVLWSIILNGFLALIAVAYAVILAAKWRKLGCTRREKIKLIMTGVAGLIMTINVIFWQSYKFW